jgi:hypothetical protein
LVDNTFKCFKTFIPGVEGSMEAQTNFDSEEVLLFNKGELLRQFG